jgi:hypothetical protein
MRVFATFPTDSRSASNSAFFCTHLAFLKKNFKIILALLQTLDPANRDEPTEKSDKGGKTFFINMS